MSQFWTTLAIFIALLFTAHAQLAVKEITYRYAKAERFQPAVPTPFTTSGPFYRAPAACYQRENLYLKYPYMSEDCLFLTLSVPETAKSEKLPVIVWIHGGSFEGGSIRAYNGTHLAREANAIVVAIQYRLGFLGFSAIEETETASGLGNLGLLDQHLAIQWVNKYISQFGGDESRITLMGQSAGGISIQIWQGILGNSTLFHRTILMSGVFQDAVTRTREEAILNTTQDIEKIGCKLSNPKDTLDCMKKVDPEVIVKATKSSANVVRFFPVIDGVLIKKKPWEYFLDASFKKVPSIIGSTKDEFSSQFCQQFKEQMDYKTFQATLGVFFGPSLVPSILSTYNVTSTMSNYMTTFTQIANDYSTHCPTRRHAKRLSKHIPNTYFYTFGRKLNIASECVGCAHGHDLVFVFPTLFQDAGHPAYPLSDDEMTLSDNLIQFFANFIRSGDVNHEREASSPTMRKPLQCFFWAPYEEELDMDMYFELWDKMDRRKHFYESVCGLWDKVPQNN